MPFQSALAIRFVEGIRAVVAIRSDNHSRGRQNRYLVFRGMLSNIPAAWLPEGVREIQKGGAESALHEGARLSR